MREWMPDSQSLVQTPHGSHADKTQSTGQHCMLQSSDLASSGQTSPLHDGWTVTVRSCARVPPPHVLVQELHASHALTWQSTLQQCELQLVVSIRTGHTAPPHVLAFSTERVRCWTPPPHALLHEPHASHCDTAQSTGQHSVWQASWTEVAGQSTPPHDAMTAMGRVCVRNPPPQVFVHELHATQAPTWQSNGQQPVLQVLEPVKAGQTAPPHVDWVKILRLLCCTPPPQTAVQVL